ncbi:MAG: hypothetical protein B7Z73_16495, partial [Planctomycetia bacterium 21-64-5]
MIASRLIGHRYRFNVAGRWFVGRGCGTLNRGRATIVFGGVAQCQQVVGRSRVIGRFRFGGNGRRRIEDRLLWGGLPSPSRFIVGVAKDGLGRPPHVSDRQAALCRWRVGWDQRACERRPTNRDVV